MDKITSSVILIGMGLLLGFGAEVHPLSLVLGILLIGLGFINLINSVGDGTPKRRRKKRK